MNDTLHPVLRIQFYAKEKSFGPGIAKLLQRVEDRHSLRAAAMSMDMAYSKAWTMVRNCEAALDMKLLNYSTGGKNGGGAVLTSEAKQLLQMYTTYCQELNAYALQKFDEEFGPLLK